MIKPVYKKKDVHREELNRLQRRTNRLLQTHRQLDDKGEGFRRTQVGFC